MEESKVSYLVIREGNKWTDVFRLIPGQVVTIGRAQTNQIVVKDERCSRSHAEIFLSSSRWTLRDLESRNGTVVDGNRITGDHVLSPGELVQIGQSQLAFVDDLTKAFPDSSTIVKSGRVVARETAPMDDDVESGGEVLADDVLVDEESPKITHRRGQTKFLAAQPASVVEPSAPRVGRAATALCRLAFELAKATDFESVVDLALTGLFEETNVDSGGVLVLPRDFEGQPTAADLEVVASRTTGETAYYRASEFLVATTLGDGEAVLARNIGGDSTIGTRDSKGVIRATSIICAPIRQGNKTLGLIHLYSTQAEHVPDPDDLEFTLAVAETVAVAMENLSRREELVEDLQQVKQEKKQLLEQLGVQSEIVGSSAAIEQVGKDIARVASSRATVLVRGESGVGKELVARAVHFSSPRRSRPFICLNCAALSESLLESELFGHERGAFTGATDRKMGKFEAAHSGTLMLDEIGEMSPTIQAKFLRVLEGHPFERVGGSVPIKVDVRVIAATNRDLERDVADGRFRRDLYFRLHVVEIVVPALRKRPEDILELAHFFLQKFIEETGRKIRGFTPEAMSQLTEYRWPGNVRELKNVIERAVVLSGGPEIEQRDLILSNLSTAGDTAEYVPPKQFEPISLSEMERTHILATLNSTGWNKSQTSQILGIERSTLDRKIKRYDLVRQPSRSDS